MKKNTLVFWKNKNKPDHTDCTGVLMPAGYADEFVRENNILDECCMYTTVTLTDEQLQLITDNQSQEIKENISLESFNPFSPKVRSYKNQMALFKSQKEAFAYGALPDSKNPAGQKNNSPLKSSLFQNTLFDRDVIREKLFSFLEPANPFK
jgi:hypothetical protein